MNLGLLMIIQFWEIVELNNIEVLDLNYKRGKKYSVSQIKELEEHWAKLYDEFYDSRETKKGKYMITKNNELIKMSLMLDLLSDIENRFILLINMSVSNSKELNKFIAKRTNEAVNDFKKLYPRVKFNAFDDLLELLTVVQSVIKSQKNIFDEKLGARENVIVKQKETIYDVVSMMSKHLGYNLNVNSMSCLEFLGHERTINSMSKTVKQK